VVVRTAAALGGNSLANEVLRPGDDLPGDHAGGVAAADPAGHHLDYFAALGARRQLRRLGLHADIGLASDQGLQRLWRRIEDFKLRVDALLRQKAAVDGDD
jgi:hypothetical protein